MAIRSHVVSVTLVCSLLGAAPAFAGSTSAPRIDGSVRAGGTAYLKLTQGEPARRCQLQASVHGKSPTTLSSLRPTRRTIEWSWQVPAQARAAVWQLSARCGTSQIDVHLTVHGPRAAGSVLALARRLRVREYGTFPTPPETAAAAQGPPPPSMPPATSLPIPSISVPLAAQVWWAANSTSILAGFHTGLGAGQCTDYVATRRPDVIAAVDAWAYLQAHGGALNVSWVAKAWASEAQQAGLPTGKTPQPGAVMVFQPGAYGATADGHIAFVDAVASDGSFTISEMHAPVLGQVTTRSFSSKVAAAITTDPAVDFIYL